MSAAPFVIGEGEFSLAVFAAVCAGDRTVVLGDGARARVTASLALRRRLEAGEARVYGINTGFGRLADTVIPPGQRAALQTNLVRSHAVGWGPPLTSAEARGLIFLRALSLARGYSGVRPELVDQLLWLLASGLHPWIPSRGSVGASGDLAPLAHLGLVLLGEGHVLDDDGRREPAAVALARHGRAPLRLEAKEGLALINGTQLMNALGLLAVARGERLLRWATVAAALS
ncbi:MAG: aromatic amino acid lyase, partial [Candidatus Krumholzibacteriia bacterium]